MSRIIAVVVMSAIVGGLAATVIEMRMRPPAPSPMILAVVDLASIIERQRTEVLKQTSDPGAAERIIADRMIRLATVLADMGRDRVILNKAAVVTGNVTDLTGQVESRLSGEGGERK